MSEGESIQKLNVTTTYCTSNFTSKHLSIFETDNYVT